MYVRMLVYTHFQLTWLEAWVQCLKVELSVIFIHQHAGTFPEVLPTQGQKSKVDTVIMDCRKLLHIGTYVGTTGGKRNSG